MNVTPVLEQTNQYTQGTACMQPDPEAHHHGDAASESSRRRFPIEVARCATAPTTSEWVPNAEKSVVPDDLAATCRRCPGRQNCLLWALAGDEAGYWAGTTKADRNQLRDMGNTSIDTADWIQGRARSTSMAKHPIGKGSVSHYKKKGCRCAECRTKVAESRAAERQRARERRQAAA